MTDTKDPTPPLDLTRWIEPHQLREFRRIAECARKPGDDPFLATSSRPAFFAVDCTRLAELLGALDGAIAEVRTLRAEVERLRADSASHAEGLIELHIRHEADERAVRRDAEIARLASAVEQAVSMLMELHVPQMADVIMKRARPTP